MGEESYFNALAHIMWEMEIDIFSEREKTLALVSDFVPKCRSQIRRLQAMYDCGAMDLIAKAVEDKDNYAQLMWEAVDKVCEKLGAGEERAVFSVNQIIALWDGELAELDPEDNGEGEKGDEDMLFLQDVAEEEKQEETEQQETAAEQSEGGDQSEPVLARLAHFWCANDCEEGRPHFVTCPIGWILILLCTAAGVFMIYDTPLGDNLTAPVFLFMFVVLTGKRQYRFDSVGRLSLLLGGFYIAACVKAMWLGSGVTLRCLPIVAAALVVFNNGRFASLLDGEKRRPALAYLLIFMMSAVVTAGVYAIQNVQL